jgi:RNA polymerase sigma-70 factor (ECF subfamily)
MSGDGSGAMAARMVQMPSLAISSERLEAVTAVAVPTFDDIYAAHVAFVWRVLRTLGVSEAQLEDAVQDVFVVVHRRLPEWEGRAAMTTWLFAIARRVASTHRRRALGARTEELQDEPVGGADTFAAMSRAQAAATVMTILMTLDEDKRTVFALVELEQLSVPEVARMLDINLNTAYSRLRLARAAFEAAAAKALGKGGAR